MLVKILLNIPRTVDGKQVGPFKKWQQVEMEKNLADIFIASAMAEEVKPPVPAEPGDEAKPATPAKKPGEKTEA